MSIAASKSQITVALVGNPNTGKSTLFNALSGVRQRIGNYPGVTVEKKTGHVSIGSESYLLVDLPGTYSLAPRSPDEMVTVDVLLGRRDDVSAPNVVLCIVDASNLERNLYLVSQVLEMELPVVIALTMGDVAIERGIEIDAARLSQQLNAEVVPIAAHRRKGLSELKEALQRAAGHTAKSPKSPFPPAFQDEVAKLEAKVSGESKQPWPRYLVERLLLDTGGYLEEAKLTGSDGSIVDEIRQARERLKKSGCPVPAVEAMSRYQWVAQVLDGVVKRPTTRTVTLSDKIDKVLTHWFWGSLVFILLMMFVFQSIFTWAGPAMDGIEGVFEWLGGIVDENMADGALKSLITDGVIAGVGGVLVFLPQIFLLFLFIAVLEDCGYMARAAYLMDRLMSRIGLSGKSFIPLLSSFACAVPGIMAARVIENRRDRLVTILVAPLMSCSARLPVYILLISAFIPQMVLLGFNVPIGGSTYTVNFLGLQGLTMFAMYCVGVVAAVVVALVLKKTVLRGATPPFVMELPSYKLPGIYVVLHRMFERGWEFVKRAGTIIFAVAVVVWAAGFFPRDSAAEKEIRASYAPQLTALDTEIESLASEGPMYETKVQALSAARDELTAEMEHRAEGAQIANSFLGRAGHFIEPIVRPLGWDWKIGCAAIASFPAREVIIGTLGVLYNLGADEGEDSQPLREQLKAAKWAGTNRPVFNIPVALSIMVFFALCAQCAATLAVIRRETNSWGWPIFTFVYMTGLAYVGALITYQVGIRLIG